MFENNNSAIVRKLIRRALRSDKRRNFFIVAAIALTAFMIASVFSVGMSYYETLMIRPFRSEGIRSHAAFRSLTPENMETLRSLDYVRRISTNYRVGKGDLEGLPKNFSIAAISEESWKYFQRPVFTDVEGKLATAENEIMLSRAHLERMGIEAPYIGMKIPMDFAIGDFYGGELGEKQRGTFILSTIYTEYLSIAPGGNIFTPIFVSEAFAQKYDMCNLENTNVNVLFTTGQGRAVEYTKRLARDLNIEYGRDVIVHPGLEKQPEAGSSTMYIAIAIIVGFFMFVGFLLIYNVMYLSVSKDVRFYGLLKTMGTTPKQLRRIVNGQVLMMYVLGLPIGLVIAALASFVLVPSFISNDTGAVISFTPAIYLGGAVFTLITAHIGASISARKAAKVSPIEAIRYAGEQNVNIKPRSGANGKPSRMAWRNMFRERKRAFIVLLSLFLGITVFTGVMAIVNSMDIAGNIDYWYDHDIGITATNTESNDIGLIGMDREFIEGIKNVPGVSGVREETSGIAVFGYPPEVEAAVVSRAGVFDPLLEITGIDRAYMEELNGKLETPVDIGAFERGEIVLANDSYGMRIMGDMFYEQFPIGTELSFAIGEKSLIPVKTQIAGYIVMPTNMTGTAMGFVTGGLNLIMSNAFLDSIGAKAGTAELGVNIEDGMDEAVNAAISAMVKERGMAMGSAYEAQKDAEEAQFTMFVLGVTISGILALIGLFNFINLITVGLLTRKREFAALESVGMSKKQMRLMLRWEGAIYWIVTIAAQVTVGTGMAYVLFRLVHIQDPIMLPQFIYPVLPVVAVLSLIVLICTITPEICYRGISKNTLVERLREIE
jgi:putative ABC transport system permease protein